MKLGILTSFRYTRVADKYYTTTQLDADFWQEALNGFEKLVHMHPVVEGAVVEKNFRPALGPDMEFIELPAFHGFLEFLRVAPRWLAIARRAARQADVWIMHVPNPPSLFLFPWLKWYGIPYALELRGDQMANYEYLKLRGTRFAWLISVIMRLFLWLELSKPVAVVSVARYLPELYEPRNNCPVHFASNARIPSELYCQPRTWQHNSEVRTIVSLGRLEAQKNPIGTLRALARLDERGFKNWKLVWIGDGPLRERMESLVEELGFSGKVELLGFVTWEEVFAILRKADLFVLNSVSEGLPRAMLEAMACALPVIGTKVGGWAEILPVEDAVPSQRDDLLEDKLYEVLTDPERMARMSKCNVETAKEYSAETLSSRKVEFYQLLRKLVER